MRRLIACMGLGLIVLNFSCKEKEPEKQFAWQFDKVITLDGVNPIGIADSKDGLWLSDGDHNRVLLIDAQGDIKTTIDSLERPMHIALENDHLYIPQYGNDVVSDYRVSGSNAAFSEVISLSDSLDAPAAVAVRGSEKAIVDFYNHRILFSEKEGDWISFGKEGNYQGDFYFPTDVQITDSLIWVADAYNNRIQTFDKKGNWKKVIGADQGMNAATGLYVSENAVFVADFENNRVLVFDQEGELKQTLTDYILKPIDVLVQDDRLITLNFRKGELVVYLWKELISISK